PTVLWQRRNSLQAPCPPGPRVAPPWRAHFSRPPGWPPRIAALRRLCPATCALAGQTTARARTPDSTPAPPVSASPDSRHPAHAAIFQCTARRLPPDREPPKPLPSTQLKSIAFCFRLTD